MSAINEALTLVHVLEARLKDRDIIDLSEWLIVCYTADRLARLAKEQANK